MARKPMVTRTIKSTKITAVVANADTLTVEKKEYVLPRTYNDDEALLKMAKKLHNNDTESIVKILASEVIEARYGMDEDKFIANAFVFPDADEEDAQ